jgi:hypothetical protein
LEIVATSKHEFGRHILGHVQKYAAFGGTLDRHAMQK